MVVANCPTSDSCSALVQESRRPRWTSIALGWHYGTIFRVPTLRIAQDDAADELLGRDPLALLIGMLLDQHMRQRSS
jgi:hypothetical protein